MAEHAHLLLVAQLGEAVELVHDQEVAARAPEQQVERRVEMQEADQRDEVGDRLVIGEELRRGGLDVPAGP